MAKSKRKNKVASSLGVILGVVEVVNTTFEQLTGKSISSWLKELQQPPRELPPGEQAAPQQPAMPLADAYAILGLPQTASIEEVKRNYGRLAFIFHPDREGGYNEAMKRVNEAYERVMREKKK
ncbi:Chaperone protein DnaJ [subsurface metagenome]